MSKPSIITNFNAFTQNLGKKEPSKNGDYTPSEYWCNIGLEKNGVFLSPFGIALDKQRKKTIPGPLTKNPEFRNQRIAEVALHNKIEEVMASLKPGESVILPLQVEIRRISEKENVEEIDPSENPFLEGGFGF